MYSVAEQYYLTQRMKQRYKIRKSFKKLQMLSYVSKWLTVTCVWQFIYVHIFYYRAIRLLQLPHSPQQKVKENYY